jgi:hypothetical protein
MWFFFISKEQFLCFMHHTVCRVFCLVLVFFKLFSCTKKILGEKELHNSFEIYPIAAGQAVAEKTNHFYLIASSRRASFLQCHCFLSFEKRRFTFFQSRQGVTR